MRIGRYVVQALDASSMRIITENQSTLKLRVKLLQKGESRHKRLRHTTRPVRADRPQGELNFRW
jgi:hypothetical protein